MLIAGCVFGEGRCDCRRPAASVCSVMDGSHLWTLGGLGMNTAAFAMTYLLTGVVGLLLGVYLSKGWMDHE